MTAQEFIEWLREYLCESAGEHVEVIREHLDQIKK